MQRFFQDFLYISHNKLNAFVFILEALRGFSRGCGVWHMYLNFQPALAKSPKDFLAVKCACNSLSKRIEGQKTEDFFKKRAFCFDFEMPLDFSLPHLQSRNTL